MANAAALARTASTPARALFDTLAIDRPFAWFEDPFFADIFSPDIGARKRTITNDWTRDGDVARLEVDVPGARPEDVEAAIEGRDLRISCHTRRKNGERRVEISQTLPADFDPQSVRASVADGVLTIEADRSPEAKSRKIQVTAPKREP